MAGDYPNMWLTHEGGTLRFGYHPTKIPTFAQSKPQAIVEVTDLEEIKWLATQLETLRSRMWNCSIQNSQWVWFKEVSPNDRWYLMCLDGYRVELMDRDNGYKCIELAYRGVEFVASQLAKEVTHAA